LLVKVGYQVADQYVVGLAGAGHGEHLAIAVITLVFGRALDFQVLFGREERFRLRGHRGL
jgi:hypothetical protein